MLNEYLCQVGGGVYFVQNLVCYEYGCPGPDFSAERIKKEWGLMRSSSQQTRRQIVDQLQVVAWKYGHKLNVLRILIQAHRQAHAKA